MRKCRLVVSMATLLVAGCVTGNDISLLPKGGVPQPAAPLVVTAEAGKPQPPTEPDPFSWAQDIALFVGAGMSLYSILDRRIFHRKGVK